MPKTAEPAVTATTVTGVILSAASVLSVLGFHTFSDYLTTSAATLTAVIVGLVALGAPILAGLHIRARVAPLVATVEKDGYYLVTALSEVSDAMDPEPDNERPLPPLVTGTRAPELNVGESLAAAREVDKTAAPVEQSAKAPAKKAARKRTPAKKATAGK